MQIFIRTPGPLVALTRTDHRSPARVRRLLHYYPRPKSPLSYRYDYIII